VARSSRFRKHALQRAGLVGLYGLALLEGWLGWFQCENAGRGGGSGVEESDGEEVFAGGSSGPRSYWSLQTPTSPD
jgi:hypothetical protein